MDVFLGQPGIARQHTRLQLLAADVGNAGKFLVVGGVRLHHTQLAVGHGAGQIAQLPAAGVAQRAQQHVFAQRRGQAEKHPVGGIVHAEGGFSAVLARIVLPDDKPQPLVQGRGNAAAVLRLDGDIHRAVLVNIAAEQRGVVPARAVENAADAGRVVGLQKARFLVVGNNVGHQAAAVGVGIHHQIGMLVNAAPRLQRRAAGVHALAQVQRLGAAELAVHIGQKLQRHAAEVAFCRQCQHQVLRVALAGKVRQDHMGVALADDGGQLPVRVAVDDQIAVALCAGVARNELLADAVAQMRGGEHFHLAAESLYRLADPPAAVGFRFQHGKPDVGAGAVGGIQNGSFVLTVTVPIAEGKGGQKVAAVGIF